MAPSIYGHEFIKTGVAMALFGGQVRTQGCTAADWSLFWMHAMRDYEQGSIALASIKQRISGAYCVGLICLCSGH